MNFLKITNLSLVWGTLTLFTAASIQAAEETPQPLPQPGSSTSTTNSAQEGIKYKIKGVKNWDGSLKFTAPVGPKNSEEVQNVEFKAKSNPCIYNVKTPTQRFPSLHLDNYGDCVRFYQYLEQYVQEITITNRTYQYIGSVSDDEIKVITLKPPRQTPLPCQLHSCELSPNFTTGILDFKLKVVTGPIQENIPFEITHKIPNLPSFLIPFKETFSAQDGTMVCEKEDGSVFLAKGGIRTYTLHQIPGANGNILVNPEKKVVVCYQPSAQAYKDSFFAAIFPKNLPADEYETLESYSESDDEFGSVSAGGYSESSSCSEAEGYVFSAVSTRNQQLVQDPYKFYKIEGEETEVPVEKNPFMVLEKNGQSFYTRAFQITCYPLIEGVVDRSEPYILQWFLKTGVSGGYHSCYQRGIGLRWAMYDDENLRLHPIEFESQGLDKALMGRDLLTIRSDQFNGSASYNSQYVLKSTFESVFGEEHARLKALLKKGFRFDIYCPCFSMFCEEFEAVFLKDSQDVVIKILKGRYTHNYYPLMAEVLKGSRVKSLQILIDPLHDRGAPSEEFLTAINSLPNLIHLKLQGPENLFCKGFMKTYATEPYLPSTLELLDITVEPLKDEFKYVAAGVSNNTFPNLKKLFLTCKKKADFSQSIPYIANCVRLNPQLQELHLTLPFSDLPCPHQPGSISNQDNDAKMRYLLPFVFRTTFSSISDYWIPMLNKEGHPNLKVLTLTIRSPIFNRSHVMDPDSNFCSVPECYKEHQAWLYLKNLMLSMNLPNLKITVN